MDKALDTSVEQLMLVMGSARKRFAKSLEGYLEDANVELKPKDKEAIGKLFAETFQTYLLAEIPAMLSFALYDRTKDKEMLTQLVPEFLDACEAKISDVPASLTKKTEQLADSARAVLENREQKGDIVEALCQDLTNMSAAGKLRASYDALLLNLLGE